VTSFRYSLNASTIRSTPILDKIKIAGETGYAAIELWHDEIDEHIAQGRSIAELKSALDDHGLAVPTTIYAAGWFETTGEEHAQAMEECKRRMEQSVELGAPYIISGPPGGQADYELGSANYRELLEIGEQIGVKPAMEFLGFVEQLNTIEEAMEVMTKSGRDDATTVLDPFHIFRGGGSVESIAKLTAQQVAVSHFNDVVDDPPREEQHDKDRVMPGDGIFDLKRYVELLAQIGYQGFLSLELFREDLWQRDPREVARLGLEKMKAVVEG